MDDWTEAKKLAAPSRGAARPGPRAVRIWVGLLAALLIVTGAVASSNNTAFPTNPSTPPSVTPPTTNPNASPDLQVLAPASPLPAKARTNLFLEVLNLGPGAARNLSVFVQPAVGSLVVIGQSDRGLMDVPANESALLVLRLATPENAGSASIALMFSYQTAAGVPATITRTVTVQISPETSPPLEVAFDEQPLIAGQPGRVNLTLTNPSERAMTQLDLTVRTQSSLTPFSVTPAGLTPGSESSQVLQGATLRPDESTSVSVPMMTSLRPMDLMLFTVSAKYTFEGYQREQSFDFGARVVGSVMIRVLEAREVSTGSGLEIAGTLVNTGTGTAWNPRVEAAEGSGLRAKAPKLIQDLKPNDAVSFRLPVERIGPATTGAPLFEIEWNDDFGNVRPQTVPGSITPVAPSTPGRLSSFWKFLSTPAMLLILAGVLLVVAAVAAIRHLRAVRAAEDEDTLAADEAESSEKSRLRRPRQGRKPKPG